MKREEGSLSQQLGKLLPPHCCIVTPMTLPPPSLPYSSAVPPQKPTESVRSTKSRGLFSDEEEEGDLFSTASAAATAQTTPPAKPK